MTDEPDRAVDYGDAHASGRLIRMLRALGFDQYFHRIHHMENHSSRTHEAYCSGLVNGRFAQGARGAQNRAVHARLAIIAERMRGRESPTAEEWTTAIAVALTAHPLLEGRTLPAVSKEEQEPRVVVRRPPGRCPFCHEECQGDDVRVCQDCLARHHASCWRESGRCAACASIKSLAPVMPGTPVDATPPSWPQTDPTGHERAAPSSTPQLGGEAQAIALPAAQVNGFESDAEKRRREHASRPVPCPRTCWCKMLPQKAGDKYPASDRDRADRRVRATEKAAQEGSRARRLVEALLEELWADNAERIRQSLVTKTFRSDFATELAAVMDQLRAREGNNPTWRDHWEAAIGAIEARLIGPQHPPRRS